MVRNIKESMIFHNEEQINEIYPRWDPPESKKIYEIGDTETIFHINLKEFVDRDSIRGEQAEEIQSDRAYRKWQRTGKYKGKYKKQ